MLAVLASFALAGCDGCNQATGEQSSQASVQSPSPTRDCNDEEKAKAEMALQDYATSHHECIINPTGYSGAVDICIVDNSTNLIHVRGTANFRDSILRDKHYSYVLKGTVNSATDADLERVSENADYDGICQFNGIASTLMKKDSN
jgi:hypothetical protein